MSALKGQLCVHKNVSTQMVVMSVDAFLVSKVQDICVQVGRQVNRQGNQEVLSVSAYVKKHISKANKMSRYW